MNILAIDLESNGLDTTEARVTELGAVLFNSETFERLGYMEEFVYEPDYILQPSEVIAVTGITDDTLREKGKSFPVVMARLDRIFGEFDFFLAHNKQFDESLFRAELGRHKDGLSPGVFERFSKTPWLCSIQDVQYGIRTKCRVLSHLALEHGLIVDPASLHRALDDCRLQVSMLEAAKVDFKAVVKRALTPWVIIRAVVPSPFGKDNDGGVGKDKAKSCGFGWQKAYGTDGPEYKNSWVKRVKENEVESEQEKLGYEIRIL